MNPSSVDLNWMNDEDYLDGAFGSNGNDAQDAFERSAGYEPSFLEAIAPFTERLDSDPPLECDEPLNELVDIPEIDGPPEPAFWAGASEACSDEAAASEADEEAWLDGTYGEEDAPPLWQLDEEAACARAEPESVDSADLFQDEEAYLDPKVAITEEILVPDSADVAERLLLLQDLGQTTDTDVNMALVEWGIRAVHIPPMDTPQEGSDEIDEWYLNGMVAAANTSGYHWIPAEEGTYEPQIPYRKGEDDDHGATF